MKYRGHETFSIRKNWLPKGIAAVHDFPRIFTDKELHPTEILGVGKNMVLSLRYWMKALGLTEEIRDSETKKMKTEFTKLGELIQKNDPLVEDAGTLCLLHAELVKNLDFATSWYFFFNEFNLTEFEKNDFVSAIQNFDKMHSGETAVRSFEDDFECILNTYLSRTKNSEYVDPEDGMESPFAELSLLTIVDSSRKVYRKSSISRRELPALIFLAELQLFAGNYPNSEIPLVDIQNKEKAPGKIFNLDNSELVSILNELENNLFLKVIRTAGLDVVQLIAKENFFSCVEHYYAEIRR